MPAPRTHVQLHADRMMTQAVFQLVAAHLPGPSMTSKNTYWRGVYLSQKRKGTKNWQLVRAALGVLRMGFPLPPGAEVDIDCIEKLVALLGKCFFLRSFQDAVAARKEFRDMWPDVRHLFRGSGEDTETFIVRLCEHDTHRVASGWATAVL